MLAGPDGVVGTYRKVHLPFLGIDMFADPGDRPFAVHDAGGLKVGMHICYDGAFPEPARVLTLLGADLLVLPTNWPTHSECAAEHMIPTRAMENTVYVMAVNRVGEESGFRFIGTSSIVDPSGQRLAQAGPDSEETLFAEIDPSLARKKRLVRVPGPARDQPNRRPPAELLRHPDGAERARLTIDRGTFVKTAIPATFRRAGTSRAVGCLVYSVVAPFVALFLALFISLPLGFALEAIGISTDRGGRPFVILLPIVSVAVAVWGYRDYQSRAGLAVVIDRDRVTVGVNSKQRALISQTLSQYASLQRDTASRASSFLDPGAASLYHQKSRRLRTCSRRWMKRWFLCSCNGWTGGSATAKRSSSVCPPAVFSS